MGIPRGEYTAKPRRNPQKYPSKTPSKTLPDLEIQNWIRFKIGLKNRKLNRFDEPIKNLQKMLLCDIIYALQLNK